MKNNFKEMTLDELKLKESELKQELFNLTFQNSVGQLKNTSSIRTVRKDIARVKKLVEENAFGTLVFCDLYMKYHRSEEYYKSGGWRGTYRFDGGGALMNQGIHGIIKLLQHITNADRNCKQKHCF